MCEGKILAITGYSKFKTSGAFGTVLRAIDAGWNVLAVQFLKGFESGEIHLLKQNFDKQFTIIRLGQNKIVTSTNIDDKDRQLTSKSWLIMQAMIKNKRNNIKMLVLDEVLNAVDLGLIDQKEFFNFLKTKPKKLDIILTGRVTNKDLLNKVTKYSDLHSDIVCKKHYADKTCSKCNHKYPYYYTFCPQCGIELEESIMARKGIEY